MYLDRIEQHLDRIASGLSGIASSAAVVLPAKNEKDTAQQ